MRKTAISVSLLSPWLCPIPRHLSNASPTMSRRHTLWVWRGFLVRRRGLNSFAGGGSISDSWQKQQHISWSYKPYIKTTTSQGPMLCIYGYYQYHIYIYISLLQTRVYTCTYVIPLRWWGSSGQFKVVYMVRKSHTYNIVMQEIFCYWWQKHLPQLHLFHHQPHTFVYLVIVVCLHLSVFAYM